MNTRLTRERADAPVGLRVGAELDTSADGHRAGRSIPPALRAGAPTWIWLGIALAAVGFLVIAVGWGQVAGETQVYLQLPYVVSAAFVGMGFVLVGLTVLNIATRQRDGADRDHQVAQLIAVMEELRELLEERDRS